MPPVRLRPRSALPPGGALFDVIGLYLSGQKRDMSDDTITIKVELHGGPLDGRTVPVSLTDEDPWIALPNDGCAYPGGRSLYAPDTAGRWVWQDDQPADAS